MKSVIFAIFFLLITSIAGAQSVTQAVFSITSSATTGTPNLRIVVMASKKLAMSQNMYPIQSFVWRPGAIYNYYLTKSTTVSLPDDMAIWVQVDQDTKIKVNSETSYMIIQSGIDKILTFQ